MSNRKRKTDQPPEIYYNEEESRKYCRNTKNVKAQEELTQTALSYLDMGEDSYFIADIGCGSGISSDILSEMGHKILGLDISIEMLNINIERNLEANLVNLDIGSKNWPFREEIFDYAISISTINWLSQAYKSDHNVKTRFLNFFKNLYNLIKYSAVIHYTPSSSISDEILLYQARKYGFSAKVVKEGVKKDIQCYLILNKLI